MASLQTVVVIHGGTSFNSYEEYLQFLKTRELTLDRLRPHHDWKATLSEELGENFQVLLPKMPNSTNARYSEWSLWLDRCLPLIPDQTILVGHSLGGIFLAKYLAEKGFPKPVKATCLVAAPFHDDAIQDFLLPASLDTLAAQGGAIYLFHSKDDPIVPFSEMKKYHHMLPQAQTITFSDRGHFNQEKFPEIVTLLKSL